MLFPVPKDNTAEKEMEEVNTIGSIPCDQIRVILRSASLLLRLLTGRKVARALGRLATDEWV